MKIGVYAISKNEQKFAKRWLETVREADVVVVADTGSTDATAEILETGAFVHRIAVSPWRFDVARNTALALVPGDVDVCVALDLDEVLTEGWRGILESAWSAKATSAWVTFDFGGRSFLQNNRMHSRHGWRWRHPCHEALYPDRITPAAILCPQITITHLPDVTKPRPNYLELLAWGQWEDPSSTRMLHYYGRELMFFGFYKDAIERFERYLELEPENPFPDERAQTLVYLDKCRSALVLAP